MNRTPPGVILTVLPGSPAATLRARVSTELAVGAIPCVCPHPGEAVWLNLPSRIFRCYDCALAADAAGDRPDDGPGLCASCGADGACSWTIWVADEGCVSVLARVCRHCGTTGTAALN